MIPLLLIAAYTLVGIASFAGLLHLIPRLGAAGTRIGAWLCRAPGLDLVVSVVTWIPPTVLGIVLGWRGVVGAIIGQVLGMLVWMFAHELANRKRDGPRIVTFLNRTVGRLNNHIALRSEEHTSELQSLAYLVCRLLLEKKKKTNTEFSAH